MPDPQATYWLARERASEQAADDAVGMCARLAHRQLAAAYKAKRLAKAPSRAIAI